MKNRIKKRHFYASRATALANTSIKQLKGILRKRSEPVPVELMHGEAMYSLFENIAM